jgi:tRNA pseudouridine55 synthase
VTGSARDGVLPVDKSPGVTSFQVVAHLKRLLGVSRIGHGGTLDPDATGVLPILIGEATKLTPYLVDLDKEYLATVRLGVVTDTQDMSGAVLETRPVPDLTSEVVMAALARFIGVIRQVPPMYSALHHQGRRLHELARRGVSVERKPREVVVQSLTLESLELPLFTMRVTCGKGTYVRTLAADIGELLGCGGAIARLTRTRVGDYRQEVAIPWIEVRDAPDATRIRAWIQPLDSALAGLPEIRLDEAAARRFSNGQATGVPTAAPAGLLRVYGARGQLLGIGRGRAGTVRPERLIHADPPRTDVLTS